MTANELSFDYASSSVVFYLFFLCIVLTWPVLFIPLSFELFIRDIVTFHHHHVSNGSSQMQVVL